ncbi:putative sucrose-phosphate synthase 4 [Canna indica]|uniref:Sucrose-phosphate synthase n=1 Tax=Canna indica TaxID=4628 RepID=A0AAQ3K3Z5_9LILI|nr:putative sucrose-phosphate synthase 4 [Canna indica]
MAGNEWINGYLEAILDAGGPKPPLRHCGDRYFSFSALKQLVGEMEKGGGSAKPPAASSERYSPTKYFVEEVVSRFDDADLHKTWVKVVATRNSQERNNRLENMCWRIWHLARRKKQIEWEEARRLSKKRREWEQGRKDAAEDISELSEGEKVEPSKESVVSRINSDMKMWTEEDEGKNKHLYIVLISLHGLIRGENMELGRDSDTGGQVKYVVELARALAATKGVYRVDLLTRQISSPDVDWTYGEPVEMLTRMSDVDRSVNSDACGAYIIRLPCGPRERYIPKERLWPHIPEFVDRALAHITNVARALPEQVAEDGGGKPIWPYVIHGHYADAGEVAARLAGALNVPMVMTGHSLGRNKLEQLLKQGRLSREDINSTYRIMRRIEGEEVALDAAEMVVTSTRQEIEEQWGLYDGFDLKLERKLRVRRRRGVSCLGRHMPRMVVIPPGMDFSYVNTQELMEGDGDISSFISSDKAQSKRNLPPIWSEIIRFFNNPHKPMILALSRPDPKKNVMTLLKAFGECPRLRELANLTLILGNRDDIEEMSGSSAAVLTMVLKLIDKYNLYGQVAYPKHHKQSDVPHIYRFAAKTKGVFINPALVEPFGLTLIEAAAYGLPVVATKNGGPVDILKALNNGVLVDPHDQIAISDALLELVADKSLWLDCRRNGLKNIHRFSWPEHCRSYLSHVAHCRALSHPTSPRLDLPPAAAEPMSDSLRDVSDDLSLRFSLDSTLVDPTNSLAANGDLAPAAILEALRRRLHCPHPSATANDHAPGRRHRLVVIAPDCYGEDGRPAVADLKRVLEAAMAVGGGRAGYVLATGSTAEEAVEALRCCHVDPGQFDALVCGSGSEIYYPWRDAPEDVDYGGHVAFRWPAEHVKSAVPRLGRVDAEEEGDLTVDDAGCGPRRYAYSVKARDKVRKIDAIRQRLRMRGFRCSLVYTRACTRLNVIPLFASRAFALRYLSIRWGIDLSKMMIIVGEMGDTDHEQLLPGIHKTLIIKGVVAHGSDKLMRDDDSYKEEDMVPSESASIITLSEDYIASNILSFIEKNN